MYSKNKILQLHRTIKKSLTPTSAESDDFSTTQETRKYCGCKNDYCEIHIVIIIISCSKDLAMGSRLQ